MFILDFVNIQDINFCTTIPEQIIAILLPLAVFLVYYFIRKDVYDLHHAILGTFLNLRRFSLSLFAHHIGILKPIAKCIRPSIFRTHYCGDD